MRRSKNLRSTVLCGLRPSQTINGFKLQTVYINMFKQPRMWGFSRLSNRNEMTIHVHHLWDTKVEHIQKTTNSPTETLDAIMALGFLNRYMRGTGNSHHIRYVQNGKHVRLCQVVLFSFYHDFFDDVTIVILE